jgi:PAS domain S-box-containing protein
MTVLTVVILLQVLLIIVLLRQRAGQKRTEEELPLKQTQLAGSEASFLQLFQQSPLGITLTDPQTHRYVDMNQTFLDLCGYTREELIGRSVLDFDIWVNPAERIAAVRKVVSEGKVRDLEFQFRRKNGTVGTARASAELVEVGARTLLLGVAADITDRKNVEQALRESDKRFRLMADSAPVLVWLSGHDGRYTDVNLEWRRFTGRTLESALGDGWTESIHPEDLSFALMTYRQSFESKRGFSSEYRMRRNDGVYRWLLDKGVPRFQEDGSFAGFIGCCVDITEVKQARAAQAELGGRIMRAQEEERSRIARELHDDICQRLALVANGVHELERLRESEVRFAEEVRDLWHLTNELSTDVQHMSHALHPSKLRYLGLGAAIRDLCREFSRQHQVEVDCAVRGLPELMSEQVSLTLFRTAQECLHNVAKHSRASHVRLELEPQEGAVGLCISDDGVGFDPEEIAAPGLGLASMRERLRLAGGEFSVTSAPSRGTMVRATVPLASESFQP